ncbi:MAG TPA: hypothetical protein VMX16_18260 [Terriglobia bacterium]|nr:hypothetical protein [Terriglobia bacterium]
MRIYCVGLANWFAGTLVQRGLSPAADHPFAAVMLVAIGIIVRRLRELGRGRPSVEFDSTSNGFDGAFNDDN